MRAAVGRALLGLPVLAAFAASLWLWRSSWLGGPAPVYIVLANLTRGGQCGPQLFDDNWFGARVLAQTNGAVSDVFGYNLPTLPLLIAPLALAPEAWLPLLWFAGNVAALGLTGLLLWTQVTGSRARVVLVAVLSAVLFSIPLREDLARGQVYLAVMLLHAVVLRAVVRRRHASGGVALGVLFALKTTGWPIWLMLVALRYWHVLAWAVFTIGVVVLLSVTVCGLETWQVYGAHVLPAGAASALATGTAYQTVHSFFQHMFRYDAQFNPVPLVDWPFLAVLATALVSALLLAVTWARVRRVGAWRAVAAGSVLSVVLMPLAEQYHYLALLAPFGVAAMLVAPPSGWTVLLLCIAAVCIFGPLPFKDPGLAAGARALLAYPRLYGALLLWLVLVFSAPYAASAAAVER